MEPALEHSVTRESFQDLWPLLQRRYPELFSVERLPERLSLYSLEYDLAALRDCYAGRWGSDAYAHVVTRIVTLALEGKVDLRFEPSGLVWSLDIPDKHVLTRGGSGGG